MIDTVRAAVMMAPYQIRAAEREIKRPGPGEVELQVGYVTICGSDQEAYKGDSSIFDFPVVFGHEFSAQVLRIGNGVDHLQEGQWVGVAPLFSCGHCSFCRTGSNQLCKQRIIFGATTDGALRDRLVMPAETIYPLPVGVSPPEGALGEPLAVAMHAVNQAGHNLEGANVIISGAGAIGLLIAFIVEQRGADEILLLEIDDKRQDFSQVQGFQTAHPDNAPSSTADCLFIATGASEAIAAIPELLAPLGTAVIVGTISAAELDWFHLLLKEGTVATSRYFTLDDYQQAIELLGTPGFKAKALIQGQAAFEELFIDDGQKVMNRARQVMRLLIEM